VNSRDPVQLAQITWQITPNLDLAPSRLDLARLEPECGLDPSAELLVSQVLSQVEGTYDYALLDCPPHLGLLVHNAVQAADEVIIPVDTGFFSLHGLTKELQTIEQLSAREGRRISVRVVPNQYDVRTKMAREILAELRKRFDGMVFETVVNFNTKLKEGASFGQPIVEFAPSSMGARDFQKLAREVMVSEPQPAPADEMLQRVERMAVEADRLLATTAKLIDKGKPSDKVGSPEPAASHEEIDAKIEAIYGVRQTSEGVVFRSHLPDARVVQIAGDFNDWMPHTTPMKREGAGDFIRTVKLPAGRYRYRLVIDERWSHDVANPQVEMNEFGEFNSIVEVL
jgi:chromosome partitioning protein